MNSHPPPRRRGGFLLRPGLADLGFALITSAMQFFLLFYYTDVAGINPALAGC
jgi:Na+/melibiose symporter-like transporter